MKKITGVLIIVVLLMSFTLPSFAANGDIIITNADQLGDAIAAQADGQVWRIKAGTYDLDATQLAKYASVKPSGANADWYFPITKSITIIGEGNPTITSSMETANGNWNTQDFITVWADDVSIDGVNILSKKAVNKAIEVMGKNFSLKNSSLLPVEYDDGSVNSGSILWNIEDAGNSVIENVTISSWIACSRATSGSITLKNTTVDFTNHVYAADTRYRTTPDDNNLFQVDGLTIKIDDTISDISKQVIAGAPAGTVISLESDIELKQQLYINNKDITIEGNGYTITASDDFEAFSTDLSTNPMNLISAANSNVTLKDINLVVGEKNKHTLNLVDSDVVLDNIGLDNEKTTGGAPLIINTSKVTVKNTLEVIVGENSWYGINLDNKKNSETSITFEKDSTLIFDENSGKDMIFIDGEDPVEVITPENARIIKDSESGKYRFIREITELMLDKNTLSLNEGDTHTLALTINPENADLLSDVVWTSSDDTIVTVENGKVTAIKAGKATITATIDGVSVSCEVTVAAEVETEDEENPKTGESSIYFAFSILAVALTGAVIFSIRKKAVN